MRLVEPMLGLFGISGIRGIAGDADEDSDCMVRADSCTLSEMI